MCNLNSAGEHLLMEIEFLTVLMDTPEQVRCAQSLALLGSLTILEIAGVNAQNLSVMLEPSVSIEILLPRQLPSLQQSQLQQPFSKESAILVNTSLEPTATLTVLQSVWSTADLPHVFTMQLNAAEVSKVSLSKKQ